MEVGLRWRLRPPTSKCLSESHSQRVKGRRPTGRRSHGLRGTRVLEGVPAPRRRMLEGHWRWRRRREVRSHGRWISLVLRRPVMQLVQLGLLVRCLLVTLLRLVVTLRCLLVTLLRLVVAPRRPKAVALRCLGGIEVAPGGWQRGPGAAQVPRPRR